MSGATMLMLMLMLMLLMRTTQMEMLQILVDAFDNAGAKTDSGGDAPI